MLGTKIKYWKKKDLKNLNVKTKPPFMAPVKFDNGREVPDLECQIIGHGMTSHTFKPKIF